MSLLVLKRAAPNKTTILQNILTRGDPGAEEFSLVLSFAAAAVVGVTSGTAILLMIATSCVLIIACTSDTGAHVTFGAGGGSGGVSIS